MAKAVTYFEDNNGKPHKTPQEAAVADLAVLLGRIGGEDTGVAHGIARMLLEKRPQVEAVYAELDKLERSLPQAQPDRA